MFLAVILTLLIGGATGAAIDHDYPQVGNTITQDAP